MAMPLHSHVAANARAAIDEIHAAVGVLAILHAGDMIEPADMAAAVRCIEAQLIVLGGAIDVAEAAEEQRLPIMTLAEVAARSRHRVRPQLTAIEGGRA